MQQQFDSLIAAVKGAQIHHRIPHDRDQIRFREITIKTPITMPRGPKGKTVAKITHPETIKIRPWQEGEMIEKKSNTELAPVPGPIPQPIKVGTSSQYHDPDATVELIARVNEADIFVHNIQVTDFINTRAHISTITWDFCEEHGYEIHPVKKMLCYGETGGLTIPYLKYIKTTVRICLIKGYNQCIPMLILKSSPYSLKVPIQLGTTVLDRARARITVEELAHASNML